MTEPRKVPFGEMSQEVAFSLDGEGRVRQPDERAVRVLGLSEGATLESCACSGCEPKARRFLEEALARPVDGFELCVHGESGPTTMRCTARPHEGGVAVVGAFLPLEYQRMLVQVQESMNEIVDLNRQIARQKLELERLNRDLSESNAGIVALHDELDEKATAASANDEVKTRIVANVSHELRTPIHSILGLSQLLLEGSDGPLTDEQRKQVSFIRTASEELSLIVDDLLDLSKMEAGNATLRARRFSSADVLSSLRGMMRPLLADGHELRLEIEHSGDPFELNTDEGKVSQVLRNLVSNAMKFTLEGEVVVRAAREGGLACFSVRDTGVGIAPEDQERIFEEFVQVDHSGLEARGAGIGLSLSRRLAQLLGGNLTCESEVGKGSVFTLRIPAVHEEVSQMEALESRSRASDDADTILIVEDDRKTMFIYERYLSMGGFRVLPARTIEDARRHVQTVRPVAILLDIVLEGETSWRFLQDLKQDESTRDIPVLVVTVTNREDKARALGADEFWLKPIDGGRLLRRVEELAMRSGDADVLVIDDDPKARYLVRKMLQNTRYTVHEAETGAEGVALAQAVRPQVILLDFLLQEINAFDVIDDLKLNPVTRGIPVIVVTSQVLATEELERLRSSADAVLSKDKLSRELAIHRIRDALRKAGLSEPGAIPNG